MEIKGLRVLVTGGCGFLGSWIVEDLVKRGADVTVYDNLSRGTQDNLKAVEKDVRLSVADIRDQQKVYEACRTADVVSHHAAQIVSSLESSIETIEVNLSGSVKVFEAAAAAGVKKVIYASSETVYGHANALPQDENHPTNPLWPYGVTKLAVEKFASIFHAYSGMKMIGLRYSDIYGPREWYGRASTVLLRGAMRGEQPEMPDADQLRDYCYVADAVAFHNLCIAEDELDDEIFNVSTGVATSTGELAELIADTCRLDWSTPRLAHGDARHEDVRASHVPHAECKAIVLDNSRARRIGWVPHVMLPEGIRHQLEWLRAHPAAWDGARVAGEVG
ncbi:MAG: NAD-dependent epimerase/dehydratase family protein [Acidobacteriota bacterium]